MKNEDGFEKLVFGVVILIIGIAFIMPSLYLASIIRAARLNFGHVERSNTLLVSTICCFLATVCVVQFSLLGSNTLFIVGYKVKAILFAKLLAINFGASSVLIAFRNQVQSSIEKFFINKSLGGF